MLYTSVFIYAKAEEINLLLHMHVKYVEENRGENEEKYKLRDKGKFEAS